MNKYMVALAYFKTFNNSDVKYVQSTSIEELQLEVRNFIDENEIFSSEWQGGQTYDLETKQLVGIIAYNGKFFTKEECKKLGLK